MAETAYYRLVFWAGMETPPPSGKLTTDHTLFAAAYRVARGLKLQGQPFASYAESLTHPMDYSATQALGSAMREAGVDAFQFRSARDPDGGINIALYQPSAFPRVRPEWEQSWLCETREQGASFYNQSEGNFHFQHDLFVVNGGLPLPAA